MKSASQINSDDVSVIAVIAPGLVQQKLEEGIVWEVSMFHTSTWRRVPYLVLDLVLMI